MTEEDLVVLVEGSVMLDTHVEVVGVEDEVSGGGELVAVAPVRHIIFIPPTCAYTVCSQIKRTARLTKYMVTCFGLPFLFPFVFPNNDMYVHCTWNIRDYIYMYIIVKILNCFLVISFPFSHQSLLTMTCTCMYVVH